MSAFGNTSTNDTVTPDRHFVCGLKSDAQPISLSKNVSTILEIMEIAVICHNQCFTQ
ncbi:24250_t:CDS:2, partial [Racocetra persica]